MAAGEGRLRAASTLVAASSAGALLQLRFVVEPLTSDEAGGVVVARAWAESGTLYERAWMDRPQGLLVVHRVWDAVASDPRALRLLAVIAVAVCAASVGSIAWSLFGRGAAVPAALTASLMMGSPALEGFAANAGLLSLAVAAPALALAAAVMFAGRPTWWLAVAGAGCAAAITVKQSAIDAPFAVVATLFAASLTGRLGARDAAVRLASFVAGAAAVIAVAVAHGVADVGWSEYWHAVAGYHLAERSGLSNPRLGGLVANLAAVLPVLAVTLATVAASAAARGRRRLGLGAIFVAAWFAGSVVAAAAGGNFHRHYFLIVVPPLAAAAGWALDTGVGRPRRWMSTRTVVGVCALWGLPFMVWPQLAVGGPARDNAAVAEWVRGVEEREGRNLSVHAMCSSAGLYAELGRLPGYRYLWRDNVELMDRARAELVEHYAGPDAPEVVAVFQRCDVDPAVEAIIGRDYGEVARVGDVVILRSR